MTLRAATAADAPRIAEIYAPYVAETAISFEEVPPDAGEIQRRMRHRTPDPIDEAPVLPWLVAQRNGRVVGYAYGSPHRARSAYRWMADVSVYLEPSVAGQGIGRGLYERLFDELRGLGYLRLYAGIALPNAASVGLHEAMGFTPVGVYQGVGFKFGQWWDVGWWQRPLFAGAQPPTEPPEPRSWLPVTGPGSA
ncbi:phosphinothricin acetyltransferase [Jatrophihabitans sp. GAS493]|nr:phosphinothricin acetyltransferase [Jatrophihabitans sp. GAS493]